MQIGWIDFSKQDKSNALNVIQSLNEPGVLDELGFGIIRNAFANDFFPGTSTLHTRSKYLYLTANILYEFQKKCVDGKYSAIGNAASFIKKIKEDIDYEEKAVKNVLLKKGDLEGVIGSSSIMVYSFEPSNKGTSSGSSTTVAFSQARYTSSAAASGVTSSLEA